MVLWQVLYAIVIPPPGAKDALELPESGPIKPPQEVLTSSGGFRVYRLHPSEVGLKATYAFPGINVFLAAPPFQPSDYSPSFLPIGYAS